MQFHKTRNDREGAKDKQLRIWRVCQEVLIGKGPDGPPNAETPKLPQAVLAGPHATLEVERRRVGAVRNDGKNHSNPTATPQQPENTLQKKTSDV